jgi:heat shock protein HslJ
MACPEEQTAFETEFLNLLSKVAIYKLTDGNLELQNNDGLPLALFAPATEQTLFVGPEQVDCTGVAPQKCLLVKEEPDADNTFFYNSIVGFNWEAGYEYELRVNVVSIPNPLADASSLRYELVEVIDRSAVEAPDTTNLVGTVWQWIRFDDFGEINSFEVADPTNYTIKFLTDGSYQLQNDCNSGGGSYEVDSLSLNILPGVSTLAACGEESLDQEFSSKLTQVASYVIEDGQLFLNLTVDSGNLVFSPAE